jgi:hypothetical protein
VVVAGVAAAAASDLPLPLSSKDRFSFRLCGVFHNSFFDSFSYSLQEWIFRRYW